MHALVPTIGFCRSRGGDSVTVHFDNFKFDIVDFQVDKRTEFDMKQKMSPSEELEVKENGKPWPSYSEIRTDPFHSFCYAP